MRTWKLSHLKAYFEFKERPTPEGSHIDVNHVAFWINYDDTHRFKITPQQTIKRKSISGHETLVFEDEITPNFRFHAKKKPIIGWYQCHCDITQGTWDTFVGSMLYTLQTRLKSKRGYLDRHGADQGYAGIDPLWTIRGFFIGLSIDYAPPYITVLCSDKIVSKWLVNLIQEELTSGRYPGWCMTRLPYISVIAQGSPSGSIDNTDDEGSASADQEPNRNSEDGAEKEGNLERIQVEVDAKYAVPTMANGPLASWNQLRHRCGIKLHITHGSNIIAEGTVGGLIQVGDKPYGLTVAHSFPLSFNETGAQDQGDNQISVIINTWRQSMSLDMEFDLALIEMPGLWDQTPSPELWEDINLVQTISNVFRPVSIAWGQPRPLEQVVLATPQSAFCLRGVFIGSQALMPIPNSTAFCTPWILRMERPWLIQPGDSGSWAFNAHTGEFLGILIAGCSELLEAYILPAYQAFDNIQKRLGDRVTLPNCQPLQKQEWQSLAHITDTYEKTLGKMMVNPAPEAIEAIEDDAVRWTSECATVSEAAASKESTSSSFQLRVTRPSWQNPLVAIRYKDLCYLDAQDTSQLFRDISRLWGRALSIESPQQCIDAVNERIRSEKDSENSDVLFGLWRYLMVGQEDLWANMEEGIDNNDVLQNEEWLMTRQYDSRYSRSRSPWDRRTVKSVLEAMESDIQESLRRMKEKRGWFSLPETIQTTLVGGSDVVLTAVRIFNHSKDLVLVVMPPPTVGPTTQTFHTSGLTVTGSSLRYPYKLGIKTTGTEEAMKEELISKMELDPTDFDAVRKLPLKPKWSTLYLKEHRRRVEFVVYEGVLKLDKKLPTIEFAKEWSTMHEPLDASLVRAMATPFQWLTWMEDKDY
ncbi:hypothetical protein FOYG_15278 [Fusarium oxysporum NRRL 32931]|uniref:Uncharacterized protein n=1 Tax=Fusarium oxysporum NRRL 32931 TaxID=660029 RepID=W9HLD1_FUSOX|nr:hypothetical protein FOYG_15278 [Fusarium oxysporum NRRL 32931]